MNEFRDISLLLLAGGDYCTPALHKLEGMPSALIWYFVVASAVANSRDCRVWAHKRVVFNMKSTKKHEGLPPWQANRM